MSKTSTRREFLAKTSGLAIAGAIAPAYMAPAAGLPSVNPDKLDLGIIGVGGRGGANLNQVAGDLFSTAGMYRWNQREQG